MKLMRSIFIAVLSLNAATALSAQQRYDFVLRELPRTTTEPCKTEVEAYKDRFISQTGVTPIRVACERENPQSFTLRVTYLADAPLAVVSTLPKNTSGQITGKYETREACLMDRTKGVAQFRAMTGLTEYESYCYKQLGWILRIDAFGASKVVPNYFEGRISGTPYLPKDVSLSTYISNELKRYGLTVDYVSSRNRFSTEIAGQFYGSPSKKLQILNAGQFSGAEQCAVELGSFYKGFSANSNSPKGITSLCTRDSGTIGYLVLESSAEISIFESRETFSSYEECSAQKDELKDLYNQLSPNRYFGAACGYDDIFSYWRLGFAATY